MKPRGEKHGGRGLGGPLGPFSHIDEWEEVAVDYLDGRLSDEDKASVEGHLASCPSCAERIAEQQSVVSFLQDVVHDEAPEDLQDRVLGELLFPSGPGTQPSFRGVEVERGSQRPGLRHRLRPWIPVTGMVAVLLVGIVLYGVFRQGSDLTVAEQEATTLTAAMAMESAAPANNTLAGTAGTSSDAATTAVGGGVTTTAAAQTETTSASKDPGEIVPASTPEEIRDRDVMVAELKAAETVAYLAFEALPLDDGATEPSEGPTTMEPDTASSRAVPLQAAEEVTAQISSFTELERLSDDLSMEGPTYAAFVSRKQISQFVDLLLSIKTSCDVDLVLRMEPVSGLDGDANAIEGDKVHLPVIKSYVVPQPAVNRYGFTTSTLVAANAGTEGIVAPDDEGTHILVVIFIRR